MPPVRPLRIAYLISQYPTISHTFVLREIRALRHAGIDLRVVSIRAADRPFERLLPEEQEEQRQTHYIKPAGAMRLLGANLATLLSRPLAYARGLFYALATARGDLRKCVFHLAYFAQAIAVGRWMRREGITHVHTHFSSTVTLFLAKVFPVTFSATIHGSDEFIDPAGFLLPEKAQAARFVCVISNYGKSQILRVAPSTWDKIDVVPLGVDVAVFSPPPFRAQPEPLTITCVGKLAMMKGHRVLIAAVGRLIADGRAIRLRLVGDGPERALLEEFVKARGLSDHVAFEGALNQERVRAIYRETDVFALASFAEGVPVVLMEAMAMQIPCVATWITGIPELIRDKVDGLLICPADELALVHAIARLYDDPELRERLGKSARLRVMDKYDLGKNVEHLAAVFHARLGVEAPVARDVQMSAR